MAVARSRHKITAIDTTATDADNRAETSARADSSATDTDSITDTRCVTAQYLKIPPVIIRNSLTGIDKIDQMFYN